MRSLVSQRDRNHCCFQKMTNPENHWCVVMSGGLKQCKLPELSTQPVLDGSADSPSGTATAVHGRPSSLKTHLRAVLLAGAVC